MFSISPTICCMWTHKLVPRRNCQGFMQLLKHSSHHFFATIGFVSQTHLQRTHATLEVNLHARSLLLIMCKNKWTVVIFLLYLNNSNGVNLILLVRQSVEGVVFSVLTAYDTSFIHWSQNIYNWLQELCRAIKINNSDNIWIHEILEEMCWHENKRSF